MVTTRRLPIGAEPLSHGGCHFRVWASRRKQVEVVLAGSHERRTTLSAEREGYFSGVVEQAKVGDLYWFRLDGDRRFPDPASRFQPDGPHGPSQIVDPSSFPWTDHDWPGVRLAGQVIYEMHIGTYTPEGTFAAAAEHFPYLAATGITVLEVMPVAEFPGQFGWGYDGVDMFAPTRLYGSPDDFRRFVNEAHRHKLAVILDVVYNHFGPDGNYVREFSDHYLSTRYENEWGDPINFDDQRAGPVREFFISNAAYWIDEFHVDGLRLDATQQIFDASSEHVLRDINRAARSAAKGRDIILVAENERQLARTARPLESGGYGLDGIWNDDFHHSARVAQCSKSEAYLSDYQARPQEFISAAKWGFLFQGQRYVWQKARRGHAAFDLAPEQFINFLENHDQVANSATGVRPRLLSSPGRHRALTALCLLMPGTPMLFQGQEFGATSPFLFFADHQPELARLVSQGRSSFLRQFPSVAISEAQKLIPEPSDRATFERCKLDHSEREKNAPLLKLHRDLLRLRREDPAFRAPRKRGCDGAVLGDDAFVLRFFVDEGLDRLLVVNLGHDLHLEPAPEPLLAPPEEMQWTTLWSSDSVEYGATGTPPLEVDGEWRLPGEAAVVLIPAPRVSAARS
jgi:maltooligosyltrehalose trehalohydrolase